MAARAHQGFIAAPELVEQIVQEWKIPFRQAKGAMERAIRYAEKEGAEGISLPVLTKALREEGIRIKLSEAFIREAQEAQFSVARRNAVGGPSPRSSDKNISLLKQTLQKSRRWLNRKLRQQAAAKTNLARMERAV